MSRLFDFERKLGYSHILSLLAILLSALALWRGAGEAKPYIVVTRDLSIGGPYFDSASGSWRYFGHERIMASNAGGRAVTLIGLRIPESSPFPGMI